MQKLIVTTALFFFCICADAEEKRGKMAYSGFSGGMLLHLGYVESGDFTLTNSTTQFSKSLKLKGLAFGIGGQARVHFGKHLRIGSEGYVTEHKYANNSYVSIGWGGFLADCAWQTGKFLPFVGATFGGGSQKNITNFSEPKNDYNFEENVSYRKYGFLCAVPFAGAEYALNKKIHLMFKVDYIFNISNRQDDFTTGLRCYLGFTFCR
jgi:hypothetical protein